MELLHWYQGALVPKMSHQQTSDFKLKSHKQLVKWTSSLHRGINDIRDSYSAQKKYVLTPNEKGLFCDGYNGLYQRFAPRNWDHHQSPTLNVYGLFTLVFGKVLGGKFLGTHSSPIVWEMGPKWQDYRSNWVETRRFCWAIASQQLADQSP